MRVYLFLKTIFLNKWSEINFIFSVMLIEFENIESNRYYLNPPSEKMIDF